MGQYLTPGVYIEEIPGAKPIAGVGTATGAFVGIAERGPVGKAQLITNWTQFTETFGGFVPYGYLAYAVNQFFAEGGTRCYVVRTCHYDYSLTPAKEQASVGTAILQDTTPSPGTPAPTLKIEALSPGSWSDHLWVEIGNARKAPASKFRLVVWYRGNEVEAHEELTKADAAAKVNAASGYIKVADEGTSILPPARSVVPVNDRGTPAQPTLGITALAPLVTASIVYLGSEKFGIIVFQNNVVVETFRNLNLSDMTQKVNGVSGYIKLEDLKSSNTGSAKLPVHTSSILSDTAAQTLSVTAIAADVKVNIHNDTVAEADPQTFTLTVIKNSDSTTLETYSSLTVAKAESSINSISKYIYVSDLNSATTVTTPTGEKLANTPVDGDTVLTNPTTTAIRFFQLTGGDDGLDLGCTLMDGAVSTPAASLKVHAFRGSVEVKIENATSGAARFKLTVIVSGNSVEIYDELLMNTVEDEINGNSEFIEVIVASPTALRPVNGGPTPVNTGLADMDFIGDEASQNGIHAFDSVDDINIMAIPDRCGDREVIIAAYTYCQNRRDCFFVADPPFGLTPAGVLAFKEGDASYGTGEYAGNGFNSSYAALYYPWIMATDPVTGGNKCLPPSGAVAGTYSNTDVLRGVHKAPAGTIDGYLNSVVGINRIVTKGEQELLNPEHINVIRKFPTSGIVIWGARTLSADPEWRYVNVRRLMLYIEESIYNGTQWVVFEPNDRTLWAKVKRDVTAFLTLVWRSGALFGSTEEEAFYVKVDDENNPEETRNVGQLIIDVGVAPVKPAEFVIFRVSQKTQSGS